jgi:hypothetical protein
MLNYNMHKRGDGVLLCFCNGKQQKLLLLLLTITVTAEIITIAIATEKTYPIEALSPITAAGHDIHQIILLQMTPIIYSM